MSSYIHHTTIWQQKSNHLSFVLSFKTLENLARAPWERLRHVMTKTKATHALSFLLPFSFIDRQLAIVSGAGMRGCLSFHLLFLLSFRLFFDVYKLYEYTQTFTRMGKNDLQIRGRKSIGVRESRCCTASNSSNLCNQNHHTSDVVYHKQSSLPIYSASKSIFAPKP